MNASYQENARREIKSFLEIILARVTELVEHANEQDRQIESLRRRMKLLNVNPKEF